MASHSFEPSGQFHFGKASCHFGNLAVAMLQNLKANEYGITIATLLR